MPPIAMPPETPQDALRFDRDRPSVISSAPRYRSVVICGEVPSERGERPHGGEPDIRMTRIGTATSSSDTLMAVVHEPSLDSASNLIIKGIRFDRQPVIRLTPADYGRS